MPVTVNFTSDHDLYVCENGCSVFLALSPEDMLEKMTCGCSKVEKVKDEDVFQCLITHLVTGVADF